MASAILTCYSVTTAHNEVITLVTCHQNHVTAN